MARADALEYVFRWRGVFSSYRAGGSARESPARGAVRAVRARGHRGGAGQWVYPQPMAEARRVGLQPDEMEHQRAGVSAIFRLLAAAQRGGIAAVRVVPSRISAVA